MQTLRELQRQFAESVFDATRHTGETQVRAKGLEPAQRVQVYRNNMYTGLCEALRAIFPVVERLVGTAYFAQCAALYVRVHPSRSGNLHDFGSDFPAHLASLQSAATLPYLADVACLEWAWHVAFHAAAAEPLNLVALAAVSPEAYPRLCFRLHPSARLLQSEYPLLLIWEANQVDAIDMPSVSLDAGGTRLLVVRRSLTVEIQTLTEGESALLRAFADGTDFATACVAALQSDPNIDLTACLQHHIQQGAVVEFSVAPELPHASTPHSDIPSINQ